jgi:hypothetical protein
MGSRKVIIVELLVMSSDFFDEFVFRKHNHYYPRVTLKTYLPVKRIGSKFSVLPGDNNGY